MICCVMFCNQSHVVRCLERALRVALIPGGYRTVANVAALPSSEPKQWEIPDTWLHTHSKFHRGRETIKAESLKYVR